MVDEAPVTTAPTTPVAEAAPAATTVAPAAAAPSSAPAAAAPTEDTTSLLEAAKTETPPAVAEVKDAAEKPAEAPPTSAAEPVVFDLTLPEGLEVTDAEQFKAFQKLLSEKTGSKENAQEMLNYIAAEKTKLETAAAENQRKVWADTNKEWQEKVKTDPVVGGAKLNENLGRISSVIDQFGKDIPTLRQTLTMTGAGNHPDVVRFLHNVSQALKEGSVITAQKSANVKPASRTSRLYDGGQ